MDENLSVYIGKMNLAYRDCCHSFTEAGKKAAEANFCYYHDLLRRQGVKFHLSAYGEWVLDSPIDLILGDTMKGGILYESL